MKVTLQPIKTGDNSEDQILLLDEDKYPVAMFFVDFLWTKRLSEHREIYELLSAGETVECEVEFKILDKGE